MLTSPPCTAEFVADFCAWRAGRREWHKLLAAVRKGVQSRAEADAARALATAAGCDHNELSELQMIRARAVRDEAFAGKYPAAKKELARLDNAVDQATAAAQSATADEHAEAIAALQEARVLRDRFWRTEFLSAEMAHKYINDVARPMGLA
jgi:hypothetical protein